MLLPPLLLLLLLLLLVVPTACPLVSFLFCFVSAPPLCDLQQEAVGGPVTRGDGNEFLGKQNEGGRRESDDDVQKEEKEMFERLLSVAEAEGKKRKREDTE